MSLAKIDAYEKLFQPGTIIDGVVDGEKYYNSSYQIAWFLKEAYSSEEEGFHMKKYYAKPSAYDDFFKNVATTTWHLIIYSSYGILNNFLKWDSMSYIRNQPDMCEVVKHIAIINVNKLPSETGTFTKYKNLDEAYLQFKELIATQIEVLQPQIHIFGSTFYLYKEPLGITEAHLVSEACGDNCCVWEKDGKLFLEVYHPANRRQKRALYVNQIIGAVESWASKRKVSVW